MKLSNQRIAFLLTAYSKGESSEEEEQELFLWMNSGGDRRLIYEHIQDLLAAGSEKGELSAVEWDELFTRIVEEKKVRGKIRLSLPILRLAVAAAASVLFVTGMYFYFSNYFPKDGEVVQKETKTGSQNIAPPGISHAFLTLHDGRKIFLDSVGQGQLTTQGSVHVIKTENGSIAYKGKGRAMEYNTLSNPRGSKAISLMLSDGTRVWLNTSTELRYPVSFSGKERRVEVKGEAYFEVAHNKSVPFILINGKTNIRVLGTSFNVNAYEEDQLLHVTLLTGSVSISTGQYGDVKKIKAGEQAFVDAPGKIDINTMADLDAVMAWKKGQFIYKGEKIENIMNDISRWYDVEVQMDGSISDRFYAEVSRNTEVSTLLQMLEATKAVRFKIEGRKISVLANSD